MLEKTMKEHDYQESALLEILHKAQDIYGYLDKDLLMDVSGSLNLPPSHVFGVATFYSLFKLKAPYKKPSFRIKKDSKPVYA